MKTIFKNKLLVASTLAVALFASYSCDDKDVFVFPEPVTAEKTMLEVMQEDDDFAQFLEVVELVVPILCSISREFIRYLRR